MAETKQEATIFAVYESSFSSDPDPVVYSATATLTAKQARLFGHGHKRAAWGHRTMVDAHDIHLSRESAIAAWHVELDRKIARAEDALTTLRKLRAAPVRDEDDNG
jgi:hypothetical protein